MPCTYAPAQLAYLTARANLDTVRDAVRTASPPAPPTDCDEATFDAWCDRCAEVEVANRLGAAEKALADAEEALVGWSVGVALAAARTAAERAAVGVCRTEGMRRLSTRARLVDLAMRLDA